jgi:hypothetical protein
MIVALVSNLVPRLKHPPYKSQTDDEKTKCHANTHGDMHIGNAIEAPAKSADQIYHRIEQGDFLPQGGQHIDRIERAAQECERGNDQHRNYLQFLKIIGPQADNEAK